MIFFIHNNFIGLFQPEGETQYVNKAVFIDLRDKNSFNEKIQLDIPKNIVYGSEYVEVSAVGDILGPSIPNLEKLIQVTIHSFFFLAVFRSISFGLDLSWSN